jgi:AP-4 complex subunit mu-1
VDYKENDKLVEWHIPKFVGAAEHVLKTKITLQTQAKASLARREIGPIRMSFELLQFNVSHLQLRYLRFENKDSTYNPNRWVRYMTVSESYECRVN